MKLHAKNLISLFGFDALVRLLGFVATTYIARTLGGEGFGLINLGLAVCSYGIILVSPGLHIIATRIISQASVEEDLVIRRVTSLRFALASFALLMVIAVALFTIRENVTRWIVILYSASLLPYAFSIDWYFQAKRKLGVIGASRSLSMLAFIVLLLLFVRSKSDVLFVPACYFVNILLVSISMYWIYWKKRAKYIPPEHTNSAVIEWRTLLGDSIPVGAANFMGQAVLNFPIILLGICATSLDIGNFSAASKLIFFLLAIDRAIYSLFYPLVARTAASKPADLGAQISRVLRYLFIVALPVCIGGLVLARSIIVLTFGSQYVASVPLMQILLFYFLFTVLNSIFAYAVIAIGNEKRYSAIIVTISLLLLVLLVPLTFYWKASGASTGMVAGEFFMMALMYRECRKSVLTPLSLEFMRPLASSLLMGAVLYILPISNFFASLAIGALVYVLFLLMLKGFTKEDIFFLKERLI